MRIRLCLTLIAIPITLIAGPDEAAGQTPPAVAARPADVSSVDAIIAALYEVISGPAEQKRDWDRFRSLFGPAARLIPTGQRADGTHSMRVFTPDEYAANAGTFFETNPFFEREIGRRTERFGGMVHVFSAYDSKRAPSDTVPFARGINSIQLVNDGTRWWVMTILWEAERPGNRIPPQYLSPGGDDEAEMDAKSFHATPEGGGRT